MVEELLVPAVDAMFMRWAVVEFMANWTKIHQIHFTQGPLECHNLVVALSHYQTRAVLEMTNWRLEVP